ncbi:MAG: hypothetical protein B7733_06070 [Myxococcales bacterium FL481]|nr:MAG: hypothetical protein B7733_06070 [Myxococcales bacterium FL481]
MSCRARVLAMRWAAIAGLLLQWSCRPAPAPMAPLPAIPALAADEPEVATPPSIEYSLRLLPGDPPAVEVGVTLSRTTGQTTEWSLDDWGGISDPERSVREVRAFDRAGQPLSLSSPKARTWLVRHASDAGIRLTYRLVSAHAETTGDSDTYYRPVVTSQRLHLIGSTALLYPLALDDEALPITVKWLGFADAGWSVVHSMSAHPHSFSVSTVLSKFRHTVFYAGDIRLVPRDTPRGRIQLAVSDSRWAFRDDELADLAVQVIDFERAFFDDPGTPYFLVTLLPVGRYAAESSRLGGTGLSQSFAMFASPGHSLRANADAPTRGFAGLLAHEMFHQWNGGTLRLEATGEPGREYWFSEGFTDFYTARVLVRLGHLTVEGYARAISDLLATYEASPVRDEPNATIAQRFWSDPDVHKLPYLRGFLVALLLEHELRRRGGDRLDHLMRELVERAAQRDRRLTEDELFATFTDLAGERTSQRLRALVEQGGMPELPRDLLAPCLTLESVERPQFEAGFDVDASFDAYVVQGVVAGSAAHRAGLRDGQHLEGFDLHWGDVERPVRLTVRDGQRQRKLEFLPIGAARVVPGFVVPDPPPSLETCLAVL